MGREDAHIALLLIMIMCMQLMQAKVIANLSCVEPTLVTCFCIMSYGYYVEFLVLIQYISIIVIIMII